MDGGGRQVLLLRGAAEQRQERDPFHRHASVHQGRGLPEGDVGGPERRLALLGADSERRIRPERVREHVHAGLECRVQVDIGEAARERHAARREPPARIARRVVPAQPPSGHLENARALGLDRAVPPGGLLPADPEQDAVLDPLRLRRHRNDQEEWKEESPVHEVPASRRTHSRSQDLPRRPAAAVPRPAAAGLPAAAPADGCGTMAAGRGTRRSPVFRLLRLLEVYVCRPFIDSACRWRSPRS